MCNHKKPEVVEVLAEQVKALTTMLASEGVATGSESFQAEYKDALEKSSPERILRLLLDELERLERIKGWIV